MSVNHISNTNPMLGREEGQRQNAFIRIVSGNWLRWPLFFFALLALFATPLQMMRLADVFSEQVRLVISGLYVVFVVGVVIVFRTSFLVVSKKLYEAGSRLPVWTIVIFGLTLRLCWIVLFPAQPSSDAKVYLYLAERLANGLTYETEATKAYWPVGYPLFLLPWVAVFDDSRLAYLVSNLALFSIGALGVATLTRFLAGERAARFAVLLFALWPNLVFSAGTPEKEKLVLALLPWATYLLLSAINCRGGILKSFLAGVLLGMGALVQPSLQLLPVVGAILLAASAARFRVGIAQAMLVILGATVVVAPWTYRNYEVFDTFVLVATNGGSVFYRANNPLATGGYISRGEIDLAALDELVQDREGRRLAVQWIKENPRRFFELMLEKQIRFMGDDAVGAYTTFRVGDAKAGEILYATFKTFANSWWMLIWLSIGALALHGQTVRNLNYPLHLTPTWLWLYLFAIHSVFESAGKYHVPVLWVPVVILAAILSLQSELEEVS